MRALTLIVLSSVCVSSASAQATAEVKLAIHGATPGSVLGGSVATDGSRILVGAPGYDQWRGAVSIQLRSGASWFPELALSAPDAAAWDGFGWAVSLTPPGTFLPRAAVGAPWNDGMGSVHVFQTSLRATLGGSWSTRWGYSHELRGADTRPGDRFGWAVAQSADTIVVGAPGANAARGAVYLFVASGTGFVQTKLTALDGAASDGFGTAVAIDGNVLVVGAPGVDTAWANHGAVYVFRKSAFGWLFEAKLMHHPASFDKYAWQINHLGSSVAISGDTVVAASPGNFNEIGFPNALVYRVSSGVWGSWWTAEAVLPAITSMSSSTYPAVAIHGSVIAVGSAADDGKAYNAGCALLYRRSGYVWSALPVLRASDAGQGHGFGTAVAIGGDALAVGATGAGSSGAAYAYRVQ
jgi:hypothetical protein